jgi:class 3 adenylate cyclase
VAEFGIIHFLQAIYESERLLAPMIDDHDGFLLKIEGDSMLAIFHNARKTLDCALAMQRITENYNKDRLDEEKVLICAGLGHGPMLRIGDADVFGAEVNAASRLGEDIAGPGETLVTGAFRRLCGDVPGIAFQEIANPPAGTDSAYLVIAAN